MVVLPIAGALTVELRNDRWGCRTALRLLAALCRLSSLRLNRSTSTDNQRVCLARRSVLAIDCPVGLCLHESANLSRHLSGLLT